MLVLRKGGANTQGGPRGRVVYRIVGQVVSEHGLTVHPFSIVLLGPTKHRALPNVTARKCPLPLVIYARYRA